MRKDLLLFVAAAAAAVAAVALAIGRGPGTTDAPAAPPESPPDTVAGPRRDLPGLVLPAGFPAGAASVLRDAWEKCRSGTSEEAALALDRSVTPRGPGSPFDDCAPAALEAMAPTLEALVGSEDARLAASAMRSTTALARRGGAAGREALARTGIVNRAFALQAATGTEEIRVETARNLGAVGGKAAVEWLVLLLAKAPEPAVKVAAVDALATAEMADGRLSREAVLAVRAAMENAGSPSALRQACIRAVDRAFKSFEGYGIGPLVAVDVGSGDPALRATAVGFFRNHPLEAGGPALVKALDDSDPRIVENVAEALGEIRPEGAREALRKRRESLADPGALRAVDRALARWKP